MESVLQCDLFLFGLNDQAFISKIISEDSPDVTAASIRQSSRSLKLVEQLQNTSKAPMPQAKILMQKVSTKSKNKATQKPKCTRGKAGIRIGKAIQQRSHSSQTLNKAAAWTRTKAAETKITNFSWFKHV